MKVAEFKATVEKHSIDGKIDWTAVNEEINNVHINPLIEKTQNEAYDKAKQELGEEFKDYESLKIQNEELSSTIKISDTKALLLTNGIKIESVDKALKLFDVEDPSNDEQLTTWLDDMKQSIPTFFGEEPIKPAGLDIKDNPVNQPLGDDLGSFISVE